MADSTGFEKAPPRPWRIHNGDVYADDDLIVFPEGEIDDYETERDIFRLTVHAVNNIDRLTAENAELREALRASENTVHKLNGDINQAVNGFAPWAREYARQQGFPANHLHPLHFDILSALGTRMESVVRGRARAALSRTGGAS